MKVDTGLAWHIGGCVMRSRSLVNRDLLARIDSGPRARAARIGQPGLRLRTRPWLAALLAPMVLALAAQPSLAANPTTTSGHILLEVEVIVRLDPAGEGRAAEIANAQAKVLRELGTRRHVVIHRYQNVPAMALHVSPEAFEFLRKHPDVISVTQAIEMKPSGKSN